MNSSFEIDVAKEAEIQRQKELIGEMPFKRIVEKIKDKQKQQSRNNSDENLMKEKENQKTLYQIYLETPENGTENDFIDNNGDDEEKLAKNNNIKESESEDDDNESTVSMIGSSPETLPRNDIPDNLTQNNGRNGSVDSLNGSIVAGGSPSLKPLNPEIEASAVATKNDDILTSTNLTTTDKYGSSIKNEDINKSTAVATTPKMENYNKTQSSKFNEFEEADDELSSNDGNSFDTVKHYPMGNSNHINDNNIEIEYGSTMKALETLQKSQNDLKQRAEEEEAEKLRSQQTYILPSVLSYNYIRGKKAIGDEDSDSDAELFATDPCRQCDTIRRDPKMKTKVCTLM
uniref:Uncharacterized protein n=1 Tax=Panagrolaimus sp. ES5 TaxID=591445 RepID=A0AC34F133_9BILA